MHTAMESHSDDYDGDDVINSANHNQTYLHGTYSIGEQLL